VGVRRQCERGGGSVSVGAAVWSVTVAWSAAAV
jgi:hypothetical protein